MSVEVIDIIKAKNSGEFPIVEDIDIKGGQSVVADTTARDAIAAGKRKEGMSVYAVADTKTYRLVGGITNDKWAEVISGMPSGSNYQTLYYNDVWLATDMLKVINDGIYMEKVAIGYKNENFYLPDNYSCVIHNFITQGALALVKQYVGGSSYDYPAFAIYKQTSGTTGDLVASIDGLGTIFSNSLTANKLVATDGNKNLVSIDDSLLPSGINGQTLRNNAGIWEATNLWKVQGNNTYSQVSCDFYSPTTGLHRSGLNIGVSDSYGIIGLQFSSQFDLYNVKYNDGYWNTESMLSWFNNNILLQNHYGNITINAQPYPTYSGNIILQGIIQITNLTSSKPVLTDGNKNLISSPYDFCRWRGSSAETPASPIDGDIWNDITSGNVIKIYANSDWRTLS